MYQATPDDYDAIVRESFARRTDPLGVALLFLEESGFDPSRPNKRAGMYGLDQMSAQNLAAAHITPAQWTAMTIAEQVPHIFAFWDGLVKTFAGGMFPADGEHLLALNFLPARYQSRHAATNDQAPLAEDGVVDAYRKDGTPIYWYRDNDTLDPNHTGAITVSTIRDRLAIVASVEEPKAWAVISEGIAEAEARNSGPEPPSGPPAPPAAPGNGSSSGSPSSGPVAARGFRMSGLAVTLALAFAAVVLRGGRG